MEKIMNVQDFISQVASGDSAQAKETLNDILSAKAFEALDAKKQELAKSVFTGKEEIETESEE
jgi:hypothetical protein